LLLVDLVASSNRQTFHNVAHDIEDAISAVPADLPFPLKSKKCMSVKIPQLDCGLLSDPTPYQASRSDNSSFPVLADDRADLLTQALLVVRRKPSHSSEAVSG